MSKLDRKFNRDLTSLSLSFNIAAAIMAALKLMRRRSTRSGQAVICDCWVLTIDLNQGEEHMKFLDPAISSMKSGKRLQKTMPGVDRKRLERQCAASSADPSALWLKPQFFAGRTQGKRWLRLGLLCFALIVWSASMALGQQKEATTSSPGVVTDSRETEDLRAIVTRQTQMIEELRLQITEQQRKRDEDAQILRQLMQELQQIKSQINTAHHPAGEVFETANPAKTEVGGLDVAAQSVGSDSKVTNEVKEGSGVAGWTNGHPSIKSSDGNFEAIISGFGHFDFRGYQKGPNVPANTFVVRRMRLAVSGKLYKHFDYRVQADFADTSSTILRDGYINIQYRPQVQFRFGQFKEPFSQEELRGDEHQDFVERSMLNNLVPARSPGLQLSGTFFDDAVEYQLGAFNGKGLLATNSSSTPEGVVRLRLTPWRNTSAELIQGLSFGGAFAAGRQRGGNGFFGRTESRSVTFFNAEPVNGQLIRANGELTYLYKAFALRAEYDQMNQDRTTLGPSNTNLPGVIAKGSMVQVTYLLTGETKPDTDGAQPRKGVLGAGGERAGAGAWEVKFRYSNLQLADGLTSNRAETFTTGLNWYLSRYVKYVLDFNIERFKNPLLAPNPGDRNFFTVLTRVQFMF